MDNPIKIENFEYEFMKTDVAQIELINCWVDKDGNGKTMHSVSSVGVVDGEEVVYPQKTYNLSFEYKGGNIFEEGFAAIVDLVTNPNT